MNPKLIDQLSNNILTIEHLKKYTQISAEQEDIIRRVIKRHPMNVTKYYASLINWNDPDDPIRKLVIPSEEELDFQGSYDTSGESDNTILPGLQHKYQKTVLLLITNHCSSFCRHCFRRRMVGVNNDEVLSDRTAAIQYIRHHVEANNVLISGGDPLMVSNGRLQELLSNLCDIDHISYIRIGTRTPVSFPDRILKDEELSKILLSCSKQLHLVTHFNHPREITDRSREAVRSLISTGIPVHNQTVLLRGINSDPETLEHLMRELVGTGICPYYVFQCRSVAGVKSHFQLPLLLGYRIVEEAKSRLSGLSKRFRYVMSHVTGKIEIIGVSHNRIYFKYHEAKEAEQAGTIFECPIRANAGWLDDLK